MYRRKRIETILNNLQAIRHLFSDESRFSNKHFGINMSQASILMLLIQKGSQTMTQIAVALGISKSAATQLLDGLENKQFVKRTVDDKDRRIVNVRLSCAGIEHLNLVRKKGMKRFKEMFNKLDDKELEQIETITNRLIKTKNEVSE